MKNVIALAALCLNIHLLSAQNVLPKVPKAQISHLDIKGTYVPRGTFSKIFPEFMDNGVYVFDLDNSLPEAIDKEFYRGLYKFSSNEFPAFAETSKANLSGLGKIVIQLTTDNDLSKNYFSRLKLGNKRGFLSPYDFINSKTDIDLYSSSIEYTDKIKEHYDALNEIYHKCANNLLQNRQADSFNICELGALSYPNISFTNANIILQFVYVQSNVWSKEKTSENFPSHALYKLIVKEYNGVPISTYSQAVFAEVDGYEINDPLFLKTTLPIAFENLLCRFMNDTKTIENIKTINREEDIIRKTIPHYDSLYALKRRYNFIRSKKQQLLFDLYPINSSYDAIVADNQDREKQVLNRDRTLDTNIFTGLLEANNFGTLASIIKDKIQRNEKKLFLLERVALAIKDEEIRFISEVNSTINGSFDLGFVFDSKESDDSHLNNLLIKLSNKKTDTFEAFSNTSRKVNNDFGSALTNNISSFFKQLDSGSESTVTPSVETSAMTNGGIHQKMDACQQQATKAAYDSQEYKSWSNTKLHADASDYKAKVIELTLQYCSDKLPPNEAQALRQAAANERRVARELRSAKGASIR
jgi:hypothetical protein